MPKDIGVYLDPSLSLNKHSHYVAERVSSRNNILKAWAGTFWRQHKGNTNDDLQVAAPVWIPNLNDTKYRKIQYTQNEALKIATGCLKMSSIDHIHTEAEILNVRQHSELLSAQYLARCEVPEMYVSPSQQGLPLRDR